MSIAIFSVVLAVVGIVVYVGLVEFRLQLARLGGRRIVTCPETSEPAAVDIAGETAALSATLNGKPKFRVARCSRLAEHEECDQACIREIRHSPDATLLRTTLYRWYADQSCTRCGTEFEEIDWRFRPPGLLSSEGCARDWSQVPPEEIRKTLASARPLCWRCRHTVDPQARVANVLA